MVGNVGLFDGVEWLEEHVFFLLSSNQEMSIFLIAAVLHI